MNFLGVGAWELIAILLIMLVFAGPKRMIHWSHVLGQHVAKFRKIWSQTVDLVQKEFDEAGVDIKLPKEPPTRKNFNKALNEAVKPMTAPMQESLDEVRKDMDSIKEVSDALNEKKPAAAQEAVKKTETSTPMKAKAGSAHSEDLEALKMGTWGGGDATEPEANSVNGKGADLGSWSVAAGGD